MRKYQIIIITIIGLTLLAVGNYFLQKEFKKREQLKKETFKTELLKWEELKKVSPTYRDAYIKLALGYLQLGLISQARQNLQQVLLLDPGWQVPPQLTPLLP